MKIQIKDLHPNPYRDMKSYPINPEKIESLKNSINQTGFWDNILARKSNGNFEIAYGHHRLEVLNALFKPTDEIDIPVKDLDDSTMIRIMANENDSVFGTNPKVVDETVRVTKEFLKQHQDILVKHQKYGLPNPSVAGIAKFLNGNWNESRVNFSLERLGLIEKKIIEKEVIDKMPTERAARDLVKAVKKFKPTPKQQHKIADRIANMDKSERGETAIRDLVVETILPPKEKADARLKDFITEIAKCAKMISQLSGELDVLIEFKTEFNSEIYCKTFERFSFEANKKRLLNKFKTLEEVSNEPKSLQ